MTESHLVPTSGGVTLYVETRGGGVPVVWVAGLADDHTSWDEHAAAFADRHLCVTFDNRGIGGSTVAPGPYTVELLAGDAHDLVHGLGLGPVFAVGSSMGGAICQAWALHHPEDLRRVVISNSWGERDAFLGALLDHWVALASTGQDRRLMESLLVFCLSPAHLTAHPEAIDEFLSLPAPDLTGFVAQAAACRGHAMLEAAPAIRTPALVIAADLDILTRPALALRLAERLPNATVAHLEAGHMCFWERPLEFRSLLRDFFEPELDA